MRAIAAGPWLGATAAISVFVVALGIAVVGLVDLARAKQVRHLAKPWWALIICLSIPWGAIAYLIFGRVRGDTAPPPRASHQ
jgi:Phospholipase_D-nuclease N-terminal